MQSRLPVWQLTCDGKLDETFTPSFFTEMTLAPLDWAIIVVYLVGCMVAGIWMRRYISHVDNFTVVEREVDVNLGITSPIGIYPASTTNPMNFTTGRVDI